MKLSHIKKPLSVQLVEAKSFFRHPRTMEEICDRFRVCPSDLRSAIWEAKSNGLNFVEKGSDEIQLSDELAPKKPSLIPVKKYFGGNIIRFGVLGDSHLCSKYERLDVNECLFDIFKREGITEVYHTGNAIDGEAKGINTNDIHTGGFSNQCAYFLKRWPRRKGITTHFITGACHEGWYTKREGVDVGEVISNMAKSSRDLKCRRNDLDYLGHIEHDLMFQNANGETAWVRLFHPGGGTAYAMSYKAQKTVESFQGGEKPSVLFLGHFHKMGYFRVRGVFTVQTGTTCDQTPFMRSRHIEAHVGGWIVEMHQAEDGHISRFKVEDIQFFDRHYYTGAKFPITK